MFQLWSVLIYTAAFIVMMSYEAKTKNSVAVKL